MADVMFNEEPSYAPRRGAEVSANQGSIMKLMFSLGVAKTQKDATVILSGIIVACLILSATMVIMVQPHPKNDAQLQRDVARLNATNHISPPATQ